MTKLVVRSSRGSSRGRTSAASAAIRGTTPIPIASAPIAQRPYSSMRSFRNPVARYHVNERRPIAADRTTATPTRSTAKPTQSPADHVARHLRMPLGAPEQSEQDEAEHWKQDRELRPDENAKAAGGERQRERPARGLRGTRARSAGRRASRRDRPAARRRGTASTRARAPPPHRRRRRSRTAARRPDGPGSTRERSSPSSARRPGA